MIKSFANDIARSAWRREYCKGFPQNLMRVAYRKLMHLHAARTLNDLRSPPGNRLEVLKGDRAGRHSIRINRQWRICFLWRDGDAHEVEIVDYH